MREVSREVGGLGLGRWEEKESKKEGFGGGYDWSEIGGEWGLGGNGWIMIGGGELRRKCNLEGGWFLDNYEWGEDGDGWVLNDIIWGGGRVGEWMNLEYYGCTVVGD